MNTKQQYEPYPATKMSLKCNECQSEGDHKDKPMVYASLDKDKWLCYKHWVKDIHSHGLKLDGEVIKSRDYDGSIS